MGGHPPRSPAGNRTVSCAFLGKDGVGQSFLLTSACRHAGRTISSSAQSEVWRVVSEDFLPKKDLSC
jgi:hypothetical protein